MLKNIDTQIIMTPDADSISRAAETVKNGGLVVFPTETVYGLGANGLDGNAVKKIYAAKGRPSDNPLILHLASPEQAERYCYTNDIYYELAKRFMPGPLTVILKKKDCIGDEVTAGLDTVAVRVPSNDIAHRLLALADIPIAAPSANLSGRPSPTRVEHVIEDMNGRVDVILNGDECLYGVESTIVKIDDDALILLRPGAVTIEDLKTVSSSVIIGGSVFEQYNGIAEAPGMKYRHYAPKARVIILDASDEAFIDYVNSRPDAGVICFDEDTDNIECKKVISVGEKDNSEEQARALFSALREFDSFDEIAVIYARMPSRDGIGLAVYNRLIKAAGFAVIKI